MSEQIIRRTAADLGAAIAAGEVTSEQVTQAHLDRIAAVDGTVNAFLHVAPELVPALFGSAACYAGPYGSDASCPGGVERAIRALAG